METKQLALKELAIRRLENTYKPQQDSLLEYVKFYREKEKKKTLDINRHIIEICRLLEKVYYWEIKRLIINVPPRSLKTELVSIAFPAWCLWKKPWYKHMSISYSAELAQKNSGSCRSMYTSDTYWLIFPRRLPLREDQNTKQHRENIEWWQYYAAWSDWTITWVWSDCITWDAKIITNLWEMSLREVYANRDCNIATLSYNHTTWLSEYKKILRQRELHEKEVYEVTFSTWDRVRATGDHKFFVLWQWYKETQNLQRWEKTLKERGCMQDVLRKESRKVTKLSQMLLQTKKGDSSTKMHTLRDENWKEIIRSKKINKERCMNCLLRQKMQCKWLYETILKALSVLWLSKNKENDEVLFRWMQNKGNKWKESYIQLILSKLWLYIWEFEKRCSILLYGLQRFMTLNNDEMKMKFQLQTLNGSWQLSQWILQEEEQYNWERLMSMCYMLNWWETTDTSQRQEPNEQWRQELNHCMCDSSCNTSLIESVTVSSVRLLEEKETVYDIEVEGNHNFYANWILVHNCITIDDPLKPTDAMSETMRAKVNNNYHDTIESRLNDKEAWAIILIMQRLHDDDLCWHLLDLEQQWLWDERTKFIVPAIAEKDDAFRKAWESFFPKRFPLRILNIFKKQKASLFACQYQQNPIDKDTQEFHEEWFRYYGDWTNVETPKWLRVFTAVDPAFKTKQHNDNSSILTAWFMHDKLYVLEYTVGKFQAHVLQDKILYHIRKRQPEKVGIEAYQAQTMIAQALKLQMEKQKIYTSIEEITQSWDKLTKIRRLVPLYRNGLIYHTLWMVELESELKRFPRWKNDDIIDSLQMLYDMYTLQPNSVAWSNDITIEYDRFWKPVVINSFYQDDFAING